MSHKVLVIILDGASFVFCNLFLWYMDNVKDLMHKYHRGMMYVDDIPITPCILHNFFTGKYSNEHGVKGFKFIGIPTEIAGSYRGKYIWDLAREKNLIVKLVNVPVKYPPLFVNVEVRDIPLANLFLPPKDNFQFWVEVLHAINVRNITSDWDLYITWYPIPDQAHHLFFPTLGSKENLDEAFRWYNMAFRFARHLIELAKPKYFLVLSDHGFSSDFESIEIEGHKQHLHVRDALVISNTIDLPKRPVEVFSWIRKYLGV